MKYGGDISIYKKGICEICSGDMSKYNMGTCHYCLHPNCPNCDKKAVVRYKITENPAKQLLKLGLEGLNPNWFHNELKSVYRTFTLPLFHDQAYMEIDQSFCTNCEKFYGLCPSCMVLNEMPKRISRRYETLTCKNCKKKFDIT